MRFWSLGRIFPLGRVIPAFSNRRIKVRVLIPYSDAISVRVFAPLHLFGLVFLFFILFGFEFHS